MLRLLTLLFLVAFVSSGALVAQPQPDQVPSRITIAKVTGEAFVLNSDRTLRIPVQSGTLVQQGQVLVTEKASSMLLVMPTGATVMMGESTMMNVDEFRQSSFRQAVKIGTMKGEPSTSTTRLNLMRGEIMSDVKKLNKGQGSVFEIKTPVGAAGIRGTSFKISFNTHDNKAEFALVMAEGSIEFIFNATGQGYIVDQGNQIVIKDIRFDQESGRILGLPTNIKVEQASLETLGKLVTALQSMATTVESFDIQGHEDRPAEIQSQQLNNAMEATAATTLPSLPLSGIVTGAREPQVVRTSPTEGQ